MTYVTSDYHLFYDVPQGSVLGLLFLILYTTVSSSFIIKPYVKHLGYATDTQLFTSFSSTTFIESTLKL